MDEIWRSADYVPGVLRFFVSKSLRPYIYNNVCMTTWYVYYIIIIYVYVAHTRRLRVYINYRTNKTVLSLFSRPDASLDNKKQINLQIRVHARCVGIFLFYNIIKLCYVHRARTVESDLLLYIIYTHHT